MPADMNVNHDINQTPPPSMPRTIDPKQTFDTLVDWVHDELIVKRHAPGLAVGISGTDSILTFLVCARAYEKAGKGDRVAGIHFGEQLPDAAELQARQNENPNDFWFQTSVIPWLKEQAPQATIAVDSSIDHHRDGLRWGALLDWSVVQDPATGRLRPRDESYWVVGTRNASEELLMNYSNVSNAASVQPISHLYKSEVLTLCDYLNVPKTAIAKSCEVDCPCGRFELPALNIQNVDALLMVRNGELSPRYVEENIPQELRGELEQFINSQISNAGFKKEIPYLPDNAAIAVTHPVAVEALNAAKEAASSINPDIKAISSAMPEIMKNGYANAACDLVCTRSTTRNDWLPEAMTLFGTPGLRSKQSHQMLEKVFATENLPITVTGTLAKCTARIGAYGFSFPKWRYLTQKLDAAPAIVEAFGMQRLTRDTDVRDASLPPSDPNRDALGTGFAWKDDAWYVEYRRGYIVCSNHSDDAPATIVIRNNSYFYGRDRLPSPVYVSWKKQTPELLQNLTVDALEHSGQFSKWQDMTKEAPDVALKEKTKRVMKLTNYLDDFDANLTRWISSNGPVPYTGHAGPDHSASTEQGGREALLTLLQSKAANAANQVRPSLYLGDVAAHTPPWFPATATPVTAALVKALKNESHDGQYSALNIDGDRKLVLLSGETGDFPVAPKPHGVASAQERVIQSRSNESRGI